LSGSGEASGPQGDLCRLCLTGEDPDAHVSQMGLLVDPGLELIVVSEESDRRAAP